MADILRETTPHTPHLCPGASLCEPRLPLPPLLRLHVWPKAILATPLPPTLPDAHRSSRRCVLGPEALPTKAVGLGSQGTGMQGGPPLRLPSPDMAQALLGFLAQEKAEDEEKDPFNKSVQVREGPRPTGSEGESHLFPSGTPFQVVGSLFLRDGPGTEAGPRAADAADRATGSVGAHTTEPPRLGLRAQLKTTGGLGSFVLPADGLRSPRAAKGRSLRQPNEGDHVCSPCSLSHPAKPVCLLRDFLRTIRQIAVKSHQPPQSRVTCPLSGHSRALCGTHGRGTPPYVDPQRGEKDHPGDHSPAGGGRGTWSTLHPELHEVSSAWPVYL